MSFEKGTLVYSKAGRDKDNYYAVVGLENEFVLIADGKTHKLNNPKRKNAKHLSCTKMVINDEMLVSDKPLQRVIAEYSAKAQAR